MADNQPEIDLAADDWWHGLWTPGPLRIQVLGVRWHPQESGWVWVSGWIHQDGTEPFVGQRLVKLSVLPDEVRALLPEVEGTCCW